MSLKDQELRDAGLKVTLPRLKILRMLEESTPHHLSAEEIYTKLVEVDEDVGLATVYRVLTQFETAGLVKRHYFEEGYSVFELNQGEHHDHLVCIECGLIAEFVDADIEKRQQKIATQHHFKMTDHSLIIYGICKQCQKQQNLDA